MPTKHYTTRLSHYKSVQNAYASPTAPLEPPRLLCAISHEWVALIRHN